MHVRALTADDPRIQSNTYSHTHIYRSDDARDALHSTAERGAPSGLYGHARPGLVPLAVKVKADRRWVWTGSRFVVVCKVTNKNKNAALQDVDLKIVLPFGAPLIRWGTVPRTKPRAAPVVQGPNVYFLNATLAPGKSRTYRIKTLAPDYCDDTSSAPLMIQALAYIQDSSGNLTCSTAATPARVSMRSSVVPYRNTDERFGEVVSGGRLPGD